MLPRQQSFTLLSAVKQASAQDLLHDTASRLVSLLQVIQGPNAAGRHQGSCDSALDTVWHLPPSRREVKTLADR